MKSLLFIILFIAPAFSHAGGPPDQIAINSTYATVTIDEQHNTLIIAFCDTVTSPYHSVIDIGRLEELPYKTRIMRYFGGLLHNDTFHFKTLLVICNGEKHEFAWSRSNVSLIVNKMCQKAEVPVSSIDHDRKGSM